MNKKIGFILVLLIISMRISFSQKDFREGYIVTKKNDTIYGLVDYRGDKRNTNKCSFKKDENSKIKDYSPLQILGYGYTGSKAYISKTIGEDETKKVYFLEYLVKGYLSIYYYRDGKDYYYAEKEGLKIEELKIVTTNKYVNNRYYKVINKEYIGMLKLLTIECINMHPEIEKSDLNHSSLVKIAEEYNDCVCKECVIFVKPKTWISTKTSVVTGFNSSKIDFDILYSKSSDLILDLDKFFPVSYSIPIGIETDIILPVVNEKLSLHTGLLFIKHFYKSYSEFNDINTDFGLYAYYLKNIIALRYTYPKNKLRPYINVGFYNTIFLRVKSRLLQTYVSPELILVKYDTEVHTNKYQFSYIGGLGLQYDLTKRNSVFFEVRYERGKNMLSGDLTNMSFLCGITF